MTKYNKNDWCDYHSHVDPVKVKTNKPPYFKYKRPNRIKCPQCKRRLTPQTIDAEPYDPEFEATYIIPPHKKSTKKRPSVKEAKDNRKTTNEKNKKSSN